MTLPSDGKKLSEQEAQSIEIAIEESGLTAVHPERMEALADRLVEKLKAQPKVKQLMKEGWRTCNALDD